MAAHNPVETSKVCTVSLMCSEDMNSETTTTEPYKMHKNAAKLVKRSLFRSGGARTHHELTNTTKRREAETHPLALALAMTNLS